jgi:hypothetical protein
MNNFLKKSIINSLTYGPLFFFIACENNNIENNSYESEEYYEYGNNNYGEFDTDNVYNETEEYGTYNTNSFQEKEYVESVDIPYKNELGVMTIPIKINGVGFEMVFDTGASVTCITLSEAKYLYEKGKLDESDIKGTQKYQVADGNIYVGLKINLRKVEIGDKITLYNIEASVVANQSAPLLLGQSVIKQFKQVAVNIKNRTITFFK